MHLPVKSVFAGRRKHVQVKRPNVCHQYSGLCRMIFLL